MKYCYCFLLISVIILSCKKSGTADNDPVIPGGPDTTTTAKDTIGHSIEFLVADASSVLLGQGSGLIFSITGDGSEYRIFDTLNKKIGYGSAPWAGFCKSAEGRFYLNTTFGGASNGGSIIYLDTTTKELYKIRDNTNSLFTYMPGYTKGPDDKLYLVGLDPDAGGPNMMLAINTALQSWEYTWTGGSANFGGSSGTMCLGADSKMYGITNSSYDLTSFNCGYIFKYDPVTKTPSKLYPVNPAYGRNIFGKPLLASDGNFYCVAGRGGAKGMGTIFRFNSAGTEYVKLLDFDSTNGKYPENTNLVQAKNGKLYGVTSNGGTDNRGVLYSYDIVSGIQKVEYRFKNDGTGSGPGDKLILARNGYIYGTAGSFLFRFNPTTNEYKAVRALNITMYTLGPFSIIEK